MAKENKGQNIQYRQVIFQLLILAMPCQAVTPTPTGIDGLVEYTEPSTFADGKQITSLQKVIISYDIGAGTVTAKEIPASSLTGGQFISKPITIPVLPGQKKTLRLWAIAVSTNGKTSDKSTDFVEVFDRLAPGTGVTSGLITATEIEVSYTEPTKNTDGTLLNDLLKTSIFYDKGQGPVLIREVVASNPAGGGLVKEKVLIPIAEGDEARVRVLWNAYDLAGNPGSPAFPTIKNLDHDVPGPPQ